MSDLYGAPSGISAYNKMVEEGALAGMHSLKLLGDIEQQPAEKRLKEAHARLYESEADLKASQMRDLQTLQQLEMGVAREQAAGGTPNVGDVGRLTASPERRSQAEPLERLLAAATGKGVSPRLTADLAVKAVGIRQKEASAASAAAEMEVRQADAAKKRADRLGALATSGLDGPQQYQQMLLQAVDEGLPVDHLPQEYGGPAVQALQNIIKSSLTVKEQADQTIKRAQQTSREKRLAVESMKATAYVQVAGARYKLIDERYQQLKKNGGEGDPEVNELRKERRLASVAKREALERKEFPPAPLDPADRKSFDSNGKPLFYTAADGKTRFQWVKDPTTGQFRAMVLPGKNTSKITAAAGSVADDDDDEED